MTYDEFIQHECHVWGEDYVFDLLDRGYIVVQTDDGKWGWQMPARKLINGNGNYTKSGG